jgi:hypothetical protein
MLKFASRIRLVSETGEQIRFVHAEEAERLFREGQAFRRERGKIVRELFLPDHHPLESSFTQSDSRNSVYMETLNGGSHLTIETATTRAREVTTQPCRAHKMKLIRESLQPLYETIVREVTKE